MNETTRSPMVVSGKGKMTLRTVAELCSHHRQLSTEQVLPIVLIVAEKAMQMSPTKQKRAGGFRI